MNDVREVIAEAIPCNIVYGRPQAADDILHALHSAGYRILGPGEWDKETDWQPIETAPKDGSRVICWNAKWGAPESGCRYGTKWASNSLAADRGGWKYQPTHWLPLPAPPAIRAFAEGKHG